MRDIADTHRYRALDSLRGLAAIAVVISHINELYTSIPIYLKQHRGFFFSFMEDNSRFAVVLFFVLSGFVLSLPYFSGKDQPYRAFIARRFCRLYAPYAFAIFLAATCFSLCVIPGANIGWDYQQLTRSVLAAHLFMTGTRAGSFFLDGPIWTLIIEMRIAIIFPLLVRLIKRFGWWAVLASIILSFCANKLNAARGNGDYIGNDGFGSLLITVRYVPIFLFGILLAIKMPQIKNVMRQVNASSHFVICTVSIIVHILLAKWKLSHHGYSDLFHAFFSLYIISLCVTFYVVARQFSNRLFMWFGNISYSLYLIHLPILFAILNLLNGHKIVGFLIATPLVFLSAHLMHNWVEQPSIRLSRYLGKRLSTQCPDPATA